MWKISQRKNAPSSFDTNAAALYSVVFLQIYIRICILCSLVMYHIKSKGTGNFLSCTWESSTSVWFYIFLLLIEILRILSLKMFLLVGLWLGARKCFISDSADINIFSSARSITRGDKSILLRKVYLAQSNFVLRT